MGGLIHEQPDLRSHSGSFLVDVDEVEVPNYYTIDEAGVETLSAADEGDPKLADLVPGTWEGSQSFCCMCGWWCTLSLLVPLAVLLPVYLHVHRTPAVLAALIAMAVVGVLFLLYSLRHTLVDGVLRKPAPLAPSQPLAAAKTGTKQHGRVAVRTVTLIINLHSGQKKGEAILAAVTQVLQGEFGIEVTVRETEYAGHTREMGATLDLSGVDALCVCGGDGSIHELFNGLYERPAAELQALFAGDFAIGIIPAGSGNSFCHDLGSISPVEMARRIGRGDACWVDVNEVEHGMERPTLSMNTVAWGLVGDVGVAAEGWRCLGPSRYDLCALWGVAKGQENLLRVTTAEGTAVNGPCATAFINHTQYFGQGLRAAPHAKLDDGLTDLVIAQPANRDQLLKLFQLLPDGNHIDAPGIFSRQVTKVVLKPKERLGVLNIDGEIYPRKGTFTVTVLPKLMRVFVPPDAVSLGPGVKQTIDVGAPLAGEAPLAPTVVVQQPPSGRVERV